MPTGAALWANRGSIAVGGFLSWLGPFGVAFAFVDRTGHIAVPVELFKSLMIVIGGAWGCFLLARVFRRCPLTLGTGLSVGVFWLLINGAADLLVLVPMSHMSLSMYAMDIGLRYLLIPIFGTTLGIVAERVRTPNA